MCICSTYTRINILYIEYTYAYIYAYTYICTHIYACIGMCTHNKNKYRDSQTGDVGSILEGRRWPRKTESRVFPSYPSTNTLSSPLLI